MSFTGFQTIIGTRDPDNLFGGPERDNIFARDGGDRIDAGAGDDIVFAGSGDDTILGGAGNDTVFGGLGPDTVVYEGSIDDYDISTGGTRFFPVLNVTTINPLLGDPGSDLLFGIEALRFEADDFTLFLDGRNNAVLAGDDAVTVGEDGSTTLAAAALLANDRDFDGDIIEIVGVQSGLGTATLVNGDIVYTPGAPFQSLALGESATDTLSYTVTDGLGGTDTATVTITVEGANDAPSLSVLTEVTLEEGSIDVPLDATASDIDTTDTLTYALSGTDAALFGVDALTGDVRFLTSPDFEAPADANGDNVYEVTLTVTDPALGADSAEIAIAVTDVPEGSARINEFHYDNIGGDVGEFIEIRVGAGQDVSQLSVELYNGNGGGVYTTLGLPAAPASSANGFDYYLIELPINGLQNGSPDGIALSESGTLIEFLSYEGSFTGVGGTADGVTSTDIGVSEPADAPIGSSLERAEEGDTWTQTDTDSRGLTNPGAAMPFVGRVNELHYDNDGGDVGEFVEIRVALGTDVSAASVVLYNGNGGTSYGTAALSDGTKTSDGAFDYYVIDITDFEVSGLQNGSPDGLALVNEDSVIEFLSYEGTFTASDGPAAGMTSEDIGVAESGSAAIGTSLQRNEDGSWNPSAPETPGAANADDGGGATELLISQVQGSGGESPFLNQSVSVSAIVTYLTSDGFFLQEEDADADADPLSSEGIFVFTDGAPGVAPGDLVTVVGEVTEFFGETQISGDPSVTIISSGNALPGAVDFFLGPNTTPEDFEAVEGMRFSLRSDTDDPITIITNFNLDRFGEIVVSAGVQIQPTQLFDAQSEAAEVAALQAANANNRLTIDDGNGSQNPSVISYIANTSPGDNGDGLLGSDDTFTSDGPTVRLGSELQGVNTGIMTFSFGEYTMLVDGTLDIDPATNENARPDTPDPVGGALQVGSFNVLNYFTTLDIGPAETLTGLNPRGADTQDELDRQTVKLVDALLTSEVEIFALQEIENGGFDSGSAIATLTSELSSAQTGSAVYAFSQPTTLIDNADGSATTVLPGSATAIGTDAITTGIIYDSTVVTEIASAALVFDEASAATTFALADTLQQLLLDIGFYDSTTDFEVGDFQRNRPAIVSTFEETATGETFSVVSLHFKSKGDSGLEDLASDAQSVLDDPSSGLSTGDALAIETALAALLADPNYDQGDGQGFWNQVRADAAGEIYTFMTTQYDVFGDGTQIGTTDYLILGDLNAYSKEDPVQAITDQADTTDLLAQFVGTDDAFSFVFDGQQGALDHAIAGAGLAGHVTGLTEWHINAQEPDLLNYDTSFNDAGFFSPDLFASSDHDPLILGLDLAVPLALS